MLRYDNGDKFEVESASIKPSIFRPEAIETIEEIGIDISSLGFIKHLAQAISLRLLKKRKKTNRVAGTHLNSDNS